MVDYGVSEKWNGSTTKMIETYVPLYRKYRPQQLSDLVGQDVVSTAIGNAFRLHKIAHAYLFCGPRGTGKTSTARIFAKSLNCVNGPTVTPCQTCPSCVAITNGTALDVTEIDAASNNGVENIRDLTDKVQFSPIQGKYKVYIIDEVHMLSTAAFNALLKTLEEPPPNVVFIFATTEPHKVLATIISRCQRFDFARITRDQIEARINVVAEKEGIRISPEAVTLIARHVRGGLRDALGLLDQVSVLSRGSDDQVVEVADVRAFIGMLEEELLLEMTQGILEKDPGRILQQIQHLQERGVEPVQMTKELTLHFRNLLIAKTCGPNASAEQLDISPDFYQKLSVQAQGFETEEIPQMLMRLSLMENQLRNSTQPQLWFEVGLLDLCYRQEIYLVKQLAERVALLEQSLQSGAPLSPPVSTMNMSVKSSPKVSASISQPEKPKPFDTAPPKQEFQPQPVTQNPNAVENSVVVPPKQNTSNLDQLWQAILDAVQHVPTKALVIHFFLLGMTEQRLEIGYSNENIFSALSRGLEKQKHLEAAIQKVLGKPYQVQYKLTEQAATQAPSKGTSQNNFSQRSDASGQKESSPPIVSSNKVEQIESLTAQIPPKYDDPPVQKVASDSSKTTSVASADEFIDFEMQQAKKYTQELLQGKSLD